MKAKSISRIVITIFVMSLLLCMSVLGIWIYWYITSSSYFISIAEFIQPNLEAQSRGLVFFVLGIVAISLIITGITLIFVRLIRQTEKNKIYNDFLNTVSHELKTPITSIQLSLETLQQRKISQQQREVFYRIIATDTERLSGLIENIIETALLDDDKKLYSDEIIVADETINRISKEIVSQKIKDQPILTTSGKAALNICFEQKSMYIILSNLIDNSIKFSERKADIRIRYEVKGNRFIMYFSDKGIGIPRKDRKKVFQKFLRLRREDYPNVKGTGLGLYYIKKIIKHFNGTIRLIDNDNNTGCRFEIKLPLLDKNYGR